jgi:ubiquinone/menaquinone biosynthesis C-methylase UbiE
MSDQIKLLQVSLLNDKQKLEELTHWLRVMNRPNGWHYDLDHIWILQELENAGIKPGATVVDAGAGQGVMQYLLAARGYNVISLDFSPRSSPARAQGIFSIFGDGEKEISYQHSYMNFISYGVDSKGGLSSRLSLKKLKNIHKIPARFYRFCKSYLAYYIERYFGNHDDFGDIHFIRAAFHDVPLEDCSVDAVISVSAIEHADISLFESNINSLNRILKPGAPLLVTTSISKTKSNTYDHLVEGWCYSEESLKGYFPSCDMDINITDCERSFLESRSFLNRLDPYYYLNPVSPFYKKNVRALPYLPVAIKVIKQDL